MGSMNPETSSSVSEPPRPSLSLRGMPCPFPSHLSRTSRRTAPPVPTRIAFSNIEKAHVLGVGLDEMTPELDVFSHQDRADLVGHRCLFHRHLQERPTAGVHRGLPQLAEVHLP